MAVTFVRTVMSDERLRYAERRRAEGATLAAIARELGIRVNTLTQHAVRNGWQVRKTQSDLPHRRLRSVLLARIKAAEKRPPGQTPVERERDARSLNVLAQALERLAGMERTLSPPQAAPPPVMEGEGRSQDDVERIRQEIAQRLEALVGGGPA
jgi:hypothetical protein